MEDEGFLFSIAQADPYAPLDYVEDYTEEPIPDPSPRFTKLMDIYYVMKNTIDMEYPYWYNRSWWQNEGDLPEIRRAKAEAFALEHMTPTIWPQELLVMNKTKNWRGAFCFPWVDASFFNAQAEALLAQADAPAASSTRAKPISSFSGRTTCWRMRRRVKKTRVNMPIPPASEMPNTSMTLRSA